jgi:hypothetical protein
MNATTEVDQKPFASKPIFVILAPILLVALGVLLPLLIVALPLYGFLAGPIAIWRGARWVNRRDDLRHAKRPLDPA